jgi:hypothetical protein
MTAGKAAGSIGELIRALIPWLIRSMLPDTSACWLLFFADGFGSIRKGQPGQRTYFTSGAPIFMPRYKERIVRINFDDVTNGSSRSHSRYSLVVFGGPLREIGRIERTLFSLEWLQNPDLRRRVQVGLNKGEAKNALARAVFFNRLGEMRDRTFENQRYRASGLNLAAIILWNTVYLERAIRLLPQKGRSISDELLVHLPFRT